MDNDSALRRVEDVMLRTYRTGFRLLIAGLCQLLALGPAWAQTAPAQPGMKIVVLQGSDFKNRLQQISSQPIVVRVEDASNRPMPGVEVTFTAPAGGPGGRFNNDSPSIKVPTGPDGTASAGAYFPNAISGPYMISIRADYQGQSAFATIQQSNVEKKSHAKLIVILAAAGGVAGAAAASRNLGKKDSTTAGPTITFGGAAVGAPGQ